MFIKDCCYVYFMKLFFKRAKKYQLIFILEEAVLNLSKNQKKILGKT